MKRLAREYNDGLEHAKEAVHVHNQQLQAELSEAGVRRSFIKASLLEEPKACPEDLGMTFVRKFLNAFNWKRAARNTSGNYLEPYLDHICNVLFFLHSACHWSFGGSTSPAFLHNNTLFSTH